MRIRPRIPAPSHLYISRTRTRTMASSSNTPSPVPKPNTCPSPYDSWTKEQLIARLAQLEPRPSAPPPPIKPPRAPSPPPPSRPFRFGAYPRLKIALKFSYAGEAYNGLAWQNGPTPLPTVEGALFDVLAHARLVEREAGLEGCGWERCGRTDRGVSAAGQVVSLWVRAAGAGTGSGVEKGDELEAEAGPEVLEEETGGEVLDGFAGLSLDTESPPALPAADAPKPLRYLSILNRLLPPTIRVLAWAPVAPDFSARFSCRARHYKYFFRVPSRGGTPALDVAAMQDAAARLRGEHDFRNLCKLDPTKQITNFRRRVLRADISRVSRSSPSFEGAETLALPESIESSELYVFDLVGTAFLYHQVRHIMAVLFLVGTRLEHPRVVSALLNVDGADAGVPVVACKPEYQMADALPLVLWDAWYSDDDVRWRTDDEKETAATARDSTLGVWKQLDALYTRTLIRGALDAHFLGAAARYHRPPREPLPLRDEADGTDAGRKKGESLALGMLDVPLGGAMVKRSSKYVPLLERKRTDPVEVANERWRLGQGSRREERRRRQEEEDEDDIE